MSERVLSEEQSLSEERPIDEGLTTATLAGLDERQSRKGEKIIEPRDGVRNDAEADILRNDVNTAENPADRPARNASVTTSPVQKTAAADEQSAPLFPSGEATEMHSRWDAIQVGFVDEPRRAVEQADALVAGAMKRLAESFAEERARLEGQWDRGDSVSTEDLRLALRRYRSFFGRVLSV